MCVCVFSGINLALFVEHCPELVICPWNAVNSGWTLAPESTLRAHNLCCIITSLMQE